MTLIKNSFGGVDLLASATDLDKRLAVLETSSPTENSDVVIEGRLKALEDEFAAIQAAIAPKG